MNIHMFGKMNTLLSACRFWYSSIQSFEIENEALLLVIWLEIGNELLVNRRGGGG